MYEKTEQRLLKRKGEMELPVSLAAKKSAPFSLPTNHAGYK